MRLPLSLHARMGLLSIVMVTVLFLANFKVITFAFEGVLADNIDVKLDTNILILDKALTPDGRLDPVRFAAFPGVVAPAPGWGWEVTTPAGRWSRGLAPGLIDYPYPHWHVQDGIYSGKGRARSGQGVHVRRFDRGGAGDAVTIIMMSPRVQIDDELDHVRLEMYTVGAQVVLVLALISILQIRVGLSPLRRLVEAVTRVRSGQAMSLPERQPGDLAPLASEINALIARNRASLETARVHAANLAHAVATPLASLMLQLEYEGASQEAQDLLAHVSKRVAHHMRRARSMTSPAGGTRSAQVEQIACEVRATMCLLHRERNVAITIDVPTACTVCVDAEDLGEMLGNLIDNACRFARSHVRVSVRMVEAHLHLLVDDDGPGIPWDKLASVLQPGVRLDEVSQGYGFGLAIVRELAELYEGALWLEACADMGGLRATLDLPG